MGLFSSRGFLFQVFKGAPVFALGYYTNDALTPNKNRIIKDAKRCLGNAKSLVQLCKDDLAKLKERKKTLLHQFQLYTVRYNELIETKKAAGQYSQERGNGSEETAESEGRI